jgi:hypothetical protein
MSADCSSELKRSDIKFIALLIAKIGAVIWSTNRKVVETPCDIVVHAPFIENKAETVFEKLISTLPFPLAAPLDFIGFIFVVFHLDFG